MARARTIGVVVLVLIAGVVLLQNLEPEEAHFLFFTVRAPRAVMMSATLALGFALGVMVALSMGRAKKS